MNSINWPASSVWVFIAQLVEHCSANAEATGSNPVEVPKNFFSGYFRNCLNCDSLRWSHTHVKDLTIICKETKKQTKAINANVFEDAWQQLEKFSLNFSSCNLFPSWPSVAKDTSEQFQCIHIATVNKHGPLFLGFQRHKYTFWLFKEIRDRALWGFSYDYQR